MIGLLPAEFADTRERLQNYDSEVVDFVAPDAAPVTNMLPGCLSYDGPRPAEGEDDRAMMTPFPCDTTFPRTSSQIPRTSAHHDGRPDAARGTAFDSRLSYLPAGTTPYVSLGPDGTRHGEAGKSGNTTTTTTTTTPTIAQTRPAHNTSVPFTFPTTTSSTECHSRSAPRFINDPIKFIEAQPFSLPASELGVLMGNDSSSFPGPADPSVQNVGGVELMDLFHPSSMSLLQMSDLVDFGDML